MAVQIKRIYERPSADDGYRVLLYRLWPRGISKINAKLNEWIKEMDPSDEFCTWFHHDRSHWNEFRRRYVSELKAHREKLRPLAERAQEERVTLLYSSKDGRHNNAVVLKQYLNMLDTQ